MQLSQLTDFLLKFKNTTWYVLFCEHHYTSVSVECIYSTYWHHATLLIQQNSSETMLPLCVDMAGNRQNFYYISLTPWSGKDILPNSNQVYPTFIPVHG